MVALDADALSRIQTDDWLAVDGASGEVSRRAR
jgi:hypothetical protein